MFVFARVRFSVSVSSILFFYADLFEVSSSVTCVRFRSGSLFFFRLFDFVFFYAVSFVVSSSVNWVCFCSGSLFSAVSSISFSFMLFQLRFLLRLLWFVLVRE